jgi:hypothetical protein
MIASLGVAVGTGNDHKTYKPMCGKEGVRTRVRILDPNSMRFFHSRSRM